MFSDVIRNYYKKILSADAILVLNEEKNGVQKYTGGNTFLEIGFAQVNDKKIFVLNDLSKNAPYHEELVGMQSTVLDGAVDSL